MKKQVLCLVLFAAALNVNANSNVVLSSGDINITTEDVVRYSHFAIPEARRADALKRPGIVREMAENLLIIRTMALEAEKISSVDEAQIKWAGELYKDRERMNAAFKYEEQELLSAVDFEAVAEEAYLADNKEFVIGEQVGASHILIKTIKRSEDEAKKLAEDIRASIIAGKDFTEAAKEFSEDPSVKSNDGDLGLFARGKMVKAFEEQAFALENIGDISPVIRSPFGFHIIRLNERVSAAKKPFEAVREDLIDKVKGQLIAQQKKRRITAIRSSADIVLNQDLLEQLKKELDAN
ncbi:peptidylprolyl isomerase [Neptunomonas sp. XY-337]|uniref:peptidylprolyl isomerase n=1 Tax=Neptunomonas sp. XY-337 TaxID=2561897 RepID=UPI0010AA130E|nr:peptidylprolyl isomerase [Neptunomonas sp. XY-337]